MITKQHCRRIAELCKVNMCIVYYFVHGANLTGSCAAATIFTRATCGTNITTPIGCSCTRLFTILLLLLWHHAPHCSAAMTLLSAHLHCCCSVLPWTFVLVFQVRHRRVHLQLALLFAPPFQLLRTSVECSQRSMRNTSVLWQCWASLLYTFNPISTQ